MVAIGTKTAVNSVSGGPPDPDVVAVGWEVGAKEGKSEIERSPKGEGLIPDGVSLIKGPGVRCGWEVGAEEGESEIEWSSEGEGLIQDGVSLVKDPGVRCG